MIHRGHPALMKMSIQIGAEEYMAEGTLELSSTNIRPGDQIHLVELISLRLGLTRLALQSERTSQ